MLERAFFHPAALPAISVLLTGAILYIVAKVWA